MDKDYYKKLVVVDFDDTLCLHQTDDTSDISIGEPNIELITRLNDLFTAGYNIEILTARGHFSTNSREEAEKTYRPVIEEWLNRHNVQYNKLNFNKPYGVLYIDDKAIRPDELERLEEI